MLHDQVISYVPVRAGPHAPVLCRAFDSNVFAIVARTADVASLSGLPQAHQARCYLLLGDPVARMRLKVYCGQGAALARLAAHRRDLSKGWARSVVLVGSTCGFVHDTHWCYVEAALAQALRANPLVDVTNGNTSAEADFDDQVRRQGQAVLGSISRLLAPIGVHVPSVIAGGPIDLLHAVDTDGEDARGDETSASDDPELLLLRVGGTLAVARQTERSVVLVPGSVVRDYASDEGTPVRHAFEEARKTGALGPAKDGLRVVRREIRCDSKSFAARLACGGAQHHSRWIALARAVDGRADERMPPRG